MEYCTKKIINAISVKNHTTQSFHTKKDYNRHVDKTFGLILLTYKGKALLMYKKTSPIDEIKNAWSFIAAIKNSKEPLMNTLVKVVEKEMGIKLDSVEKVTDNFYHARLSDDNVNQIKRDEDQLLDFFTPKDLEKLSLSNSTADFISKYNSLI